jgi:hypothetical protein
MSTLTNVTDASPTPAAPATEVPTETVLSGFLRNFFIGAHERFAERRAQLESVEETPAVRIIWLHAEICDAPKMTLEKALMAGWELTDQKSKVGKHGKWRQWCAENIPQVPERSVQRYIQLFENREWLQEHYKTDTVSDLPVGIRGALKAIQDRDKTKADKGVTEEAVSPAIDTVPPQIAQDVAGVTQPALEAASIIEPKNPVAPPKQPAKPVIDVEAEVEQEHESPVQSEQTPVLDDGEPDTITCYKVDATITIRVTRATDASSEEEAIRLVKRIYGEGLERHLKAYVETYKNCDNVDICSMTWSATP